MLKKAVLFLLLPLFAFSSEFKKHLEKDAESLKYLQTPEDNRRLGHFAAMFDMAEKREKPAGEIPKVLHFIWLGSKPFPASSIKNVRKWVDKHSGWKVKFWTDLGQNAPDDRMEVRTLDLFPLDALKELYERAPSLEEKSYILRYAVLMQDGGAYIDNDTTCLNSIEELRSGYDFFCGMAPLGASPLASSVAASPHFIAATPHHPITGSVKKWLLSEEATCDASVRQKAFSALSAGIKESYARAGRKDVVFPPDYFSFSNESGALYAVHRHSEMEREKPSLPIQLPVVGSIAAVAILGLLYVTLRRKQRLQEHEK